MHPRTAAGPRRLTPAASALAALTLLVALLAPAASGASRASATPTVAAAATVTPTDVGLPAWWDGDCDARRWGRIASSYGWTGVGSHRLGASYLGVPVCGPRPFVDGSPNVLWGRAGWGEAEWQCVELAQRFMAQVYGTKAYQANGSQVVRNYRAAYGGGLVTIANGTVGRAPVPGDIVSFTTPNNPWGHVVVVTRTSIDATGTGTVTMLSQNDTVDGWRTLPVTKWRLASLGSLTPYGWLHDPLGRGNPLGEGAFVRPSNSTSFYRIVGGAPVLVVSWDSYGGPQPYAVIDPPQFARLRTYPVDGTYLRDTATAQVYRMVGGAALAVDPSDAAKLPGWGTAAVIDVDHLALARRDHLRPWPYDHSQLCRVDTGDCYVTAGGAPMLVPKADMATTLGWSARRTQYVSGAEFRTYTSIRTTPVDGTFLCDSTTLRCYSTAGGAPLLMGTGDPAVPGFDATRAVHAPHWEFARAVHLRSHPVDGTVLCPVGDPRCYVVAGTAPIVIASAAVPTTRPVRIARTELTHPGRLALRPVDGTLLRAAQNGATYVVRGGAAQLVPPSATTGLVGTPVVVDRYAVDNAGVSGPWVHLASRPAVARLDAPALSFTTSRWVSLSWQAPVSSSAATTYDVRYRRAAYNADFTGWAGPPAWRSLRATTVRAGVAPGFTYCYEVRAHNRAGQIGPWSPARCSGTAVDDRAGTSTSAGWRRGTSPVLYGGTSTRTETHGAWWKLAGVTVDRIGVVATACRTCGSVTVWLNRTRLAVIDLSSPTTVYQKLVELPRFPLTTGVVTIVVTSPTGKTVQLDGLALSRA